jgi:methionine synthase I (cobalamin-dependent)
MRFPYSLPLVLDGGTGTNLIAAGMPAGVCVEQWILEHPKVMVELQSRFIQAGSNALYAPTFGANRAKLKNYGLQDHVEEMNLRLVELSKQAAGNSGVLIGGDLSPTGLMAAPYGEATFEEIYQVYAEQVRVLKKAGVDFIGLETQLSFADLRAGVLAAKEAGLPVFVSMTVEENGRTLMGCKLLPVLLTLQAMGADAVGLNCSAGPSMMEPILKNVLPHASVPLIAKPNAGIPREDDPTQYDLLPEQFAEQMEALLRLGVGIVGGCCGTRPEHIAALSLAVRRHPFHPICENPDTYAAVVENECYFLGEDISLSKPLQCTYDLADDLISLEDGPDNVALVEINSKDDIELLLENAAMSRLPIEISSQDPAVLEYALRNFPGRLLVDGQRGIEEHTLQLLAKKYGAIVY